MVPTSVLRNSIMGTLETCSAHLFGICQKAASCKIIWSKINLLQGKIFENLLLKHI